MNRFAIVYTEGRPLELIALTAYAGIFYDERPLLKTVVKCVSVIYRGERFDACQVAKDLESMFRAVTSTKEITVRAMIWVTNPERTEQSLVDLEEARAASSPRSP